MDRGAWQATVTVLQRVWRDWSDLACTHILCTRLILGIKDSNLNWTSSMPICVLITYTACDLKSYSFCYTAASREGIWGYNGLPLTSGCSDRVQLSWSMKYDPWCTGIVRLIITVKQPAHLSWLLSGLSYLHAFFVSKVSQSRFSYPHFTEYYFLCLKKKTNSTLQLNSPNLPLFFKTPARCYLFWKLFFLNLPDGVR